MAISRAQLAKELEPGLNALFGMEYARYDQEDKEIYDTESSERAFEEEVMLAGFGSAPVKSEGSAVSFDDAQEAYTARYTHETIALAFSITEEAIEDNLYDRLASRYTKALARKELCATDHPLVTGNTLRNEPSTAADLNETSLENALIDIAGFVDERGLKVSVRGLKLIVPSALQFVADRLLESTLRPGTADNDVNATRNMGMLPQGYVVNHYLTDTDAFFIKTDAPRGFVHFERMGMSTKMEGDFDTGNVRFKARERYSYGYSDPRCIYGSPGAA
mgnify:CR=1 FL=1